MRDLHSLAVQDSRQHARMGPSEDGRYMADYDSARNGISYVISMDYLAEKKSFLAREGYVGMGAKVHGTGRRSCRLRRSSQPHVYGEASTSIVNMWATPIAMASWMGSYGTPTGLLLYVLSSFHCTDSGEE
jgi:hypothetical protein